METAILKQELIDMGCDKESASDIAVKCERGNIREGLVKLKSYRCRLMDEYHESGRRVDRIDYLIRQTEKELK